MEKERISLKEIIGPSYNTRKIIHDKVQEISYYLIVAIISIIMMFIVPLISGSLYGDMGLYFPKTKEAWIIYIILKVSLAIGNVSIFVMFKNQAKTNIRDDENYKAAQNKLSEYAGTKHIFIPRSPRQMNRREYTVKGTTVFISSVAASVAISSLIISFDLITFLSCIVTTITTVCFSWSTMLKNEIYWTEEFPLYVNMITKDSQEGGINKEC